MANRSRERSRRDVLRTGGAVLAGTALAGCSGGSTEEKRLPGDSVTVGGLRVTLVSYHLDQEVGVVPESRPGTGNGTATGRPPVTTARRGGGRAFLVVVVRMENVSDEPVSTPAPGRGVPYADGTITLSVVGADSPAITIADDLYLDDQVVDALSEEVGRIRAQLDPDQSVAGFLAYDVATGIDLSKVELTVSANPEGTNKPFTWQLAE